MNQHNEPELRQLAEDAIEQLANLHNTSPTSNLREQAFHVIDKVSDYLATKYPEIPEACLKHIEHATQAALHAHYPRVIHETHNALDTSDRNTRQNNKGLASKPNQERTDELLQKLKRTKAPTP